MAKGFFKGVKSELKKVVWPTKSQLINNTITGVTVDGYKSRVFGKNIEY